MRSDRRDHSSDATRRVDYRVGCPGRRFFRRGRRRFLRRPTAEQRWPNLSIVAAAACLRDGHVAERATCDSPSVWAGVVTASTRRPAVFDASRAGGIPSWNGGPYELESSSVLLPAHPDSVPARRL